MNIIVSFESAERGDSNSVAYIAFHLLLMILEAVIYHVITELILIQKHNYNAQISLENTSD